MSAYGNAMGFERLTVTSTAIKTLTPSKYQPANFTNNVQASVAMITVDGTAGSNDIRYTIDATAPTTSTGHLVAAGQGVVVYGWNNIKNFQGIATGTTTTIQVTYFKS